MKDRDQLSVVRDQSKAPRIVESYTCWSCGEASGDINCCEKCFRELLAEEREWLRREERLLFAPAPEQRSLEVGSPWFEKAKAISQRLCAVFLVSVAGWLLCLAWQGILWVRAYSGQ